MPDTIATHSRKTTQRRSLCCLLILTVLITVWAWPTLGQDDNGADAPTPTAAADDAKADDSTDGAADKKPKDDSVEDAEEEPEGTWIEQKLNAAFEPVNGVLEVALFWDVAFGAFQRDKMKDGKPVKDEDGNVEKEGATLPFIVVFLATASIFFTLWYGFINVRAFRHSVKVIRGHYDNPEDEGQISHFKALTSALSATIGLGNIAGVAIAVKTGGPGAIVWMVVLAVFGMTAKFNECTLAQLYRKIDDKGEVSGGPMYYLDLGLKEKGPAWGMIGKALAILFAVLVMIAAFGGGNMFQANQSFGAFEKAISLASGEQLSENTIGAMKVGYGLIMAAIVGFVILGGITRIGEATSKIVPTMCGLYVLASITIILTHLGQVGDAFGLIIKSAFNADAAIGGVIGVMIIGFTRAAFSNEAGVGSAAIAHSAAKTKEPVREGIVAMIGPFIDTIIICVMTGLVVTITGAYKSPSDEGAAVTMEAFQSSDVLAGWFPYILTACIVLFAFSTMISWCYYGERGWGYLFGLESVMIYRVIFVVFVFVGSVASLGNVLAFSDFMILAMAFPSIIGGVILCPKVKARLHDYWSRYKSGDMPVYDGTASGPVKPKGGSEFDI